MGVFGDIRTFLGATGSVFMILALAAADHLWGDHVFNCPCGNQLVRRLYTSAFFVVPPVLIIIIDVSWGVLCSGCGSSCCKDKCRACETVCRLVARPIIIAIVWFIFSCMEPKFGTCIYETSSCDSESERRASKLRFVMACVMFSLTLLLVVGAVFLCCCCVKSSQVSRQGSCPALTRSLYTIGLVPKTVLTLRLEALMDERLLVDLSNDAISRLGSSITIGQLEILRVHRKDILLVKWLLGEKNYTEDDVRKILAKTLSLKETIEPVRKSLNSENTPTNDAVENLVSELSRHSINPIPSEPKEAGNQSKPKEAGNQSKPKEAGNQSKPKEAGNQSSPKEAVNPSKPEETGNPCMLGDPVLQSLEIGEDV